MRWLKLDCRMLRDGRVMRLAWGDRMLWVGLLALAREQGGDGRIAAAPGKGYTAAELAVLMTRTEAEAPKRTLEGLEALVGQGLIGWEGDGEVISIPNFYRWQGVSPSQEPDYTKDYKKKYRKQTGKSHVRRMSEARPKNVRRLSEGVRSLEERRVEETRKAERSTASVQQLLVQETGPDTTQDTKAGKRLTPQQQVIEAYKRQRGLAAHDPAQNRVLFPKFARAAKNLLEMTHGDVALAITAMREIGGVLEGHGREWRLHTVVSEYPEWAKDTGRNVGRT